MSTKTEFIPLMRIESDVKAQLEIEAAKQGRTLTNYVQYVLMLEAKRLGKMSRTK